MAAESARKMKASRPRKTDLKICLGALLGMLAVLLSPTALRAQVEALPEPQLKALFLYNFAKFVDWPQTAFPETNSPLVIGIIGENPFEEFLERTLQKKKINEHPL